MCERCSSGRKLLLGIVSMVVSHCGFASVMVVSLCVGMVHVMVDIVSGRHGMVHVIKMVVHSGFAVVWHVVDCITLAKPQPQR